MAVRIDLTGQKYGRLTVIEYAGKGKNHTHKWKCRCDCGNETVVNGYALRNGNTRSCGCLWKEVTRAKSTTHGMKRTKLYNIWCGMKKRCDYEGNANYKDYGGRGIKVCEEWQKFEPFMEWALTHGYTDELSIDRINPNEGYCPKNCRWVDRYTQANNKTNNRHLTYNGETHTFAEWSRIAGIPYETLRWRLIRGWSAQRTLTEPIHRTRKSK